MPKLLEIKLHNQAESKRFEIKEIDCDVYTLLSVRSALELYNFLKQLLKDNNLLDEYEFIHLENNLTKRKLLITGSICDHVNNLTDITLQMISKPETFAKDSKKKETIKKKPASPDS